MSNLTNYKVRFTVRENNCNPSSPIVELVLDKPINTFTVHTLMTLKNLADSNCLWVDPHDGHPPVLVRIFYSQYFSRWIATTSKDNRECNNLLRLPIYFGARSENGKVFYDSCNQ